MWDGLKLRAPAYPGLATTHAIVTFFSLEKWNFCEVSLSRNILHSSIFFFFHIHHMLLIYHHFLSPRPLFSEYQLRRNFIKTVSLVLDIKHIFKWNTDFLHKCLIFSISVPWKVTFVKFFSVYLQNAATYYNQSNQIAGFHCNCSASLLLFAPPWPDF